MTGKPRALPIGKSVVRSASILDRSLAWRYLDGMISFSNNTDWPRIISFCLLTLLAGCGGGKSAPVSREETALPEYEAETFAVVERDWPLIVRCQGSLYPDEIATLGIKVDGRVVEVHVDVGDIVEAGQPLLTVYQDDFKLRVEQAEAQLAQARSAVGLVPEDPVEKLDPVNAPPVREQRALWDESIANLNRAQDLLRQGALVRAEFDQIASSERVAAARYDSALNGVREKIAFIRVQQATLELAEENLRNTVLRAPFEAVVHTRLVAAGSYVKIGDPLFSLVRIQQLRFRGNVPERLSQLVQPGQNVEVKIESVVEPRITTVERITPFLELSSRSLQFEALLENSDRSLRAGLYANAFVTVDPQARAIVVPVSAVIQFAGVEKVWKVQDGRVAEQPVLLGERREDEIQIIRGLEEGDVILKDASNGREGILVNQAAMGPPPS